MKRVESCQKGFTLIEVLMSMAILVMAASMIIPMYRSYQLTSEIDTAKNQVVAGLVRAQGNARAGKNDKKWGFQPPTGILFSQTDGGIRDPADEEVFPIPGTVQVSGLTEVVFDKRGYPDRAGTITMTAQSGDQRRISVEVEVTLLGGISTKQGTPEELAAAASSAQSSNAVTLTPAPPPPTPPPPSASNYIPSCTPYRMYPESGNQACRDAYIAECDGTVKGMGNLSGFFGSLASNIDFQDGNNPRHVPVHMCISFGPSAFGQPEWISLFGGSNNTACKDGNGNQNGDAIREDGGDSAYREAQVQTASILRLSARGFLKQGNNILFEKEYISDEWDVDNPSADLGMRHIWIMRTGQDVTDNPNMGNSEPLLTLLTQRGLIRNEKYLYLAPTQVVIAVELEELKTPQADFDDAVIYATMASPYMVDCLSAI